jgi:hypothetical protein
MADAPAAKTDAAQATEKAPKKKKLRPTNCAQSNKRIRRKDWYYRDGVYFANKKNHKLWAAKKAEEKAKAAAKEKEAAEPQATA